MSKLIILHRLKVENANAIAGLTWGFPAITHFLGYTHALSRKLEASHGLTLNGCGVVCHSHQVHAHTSGWDYQFALTRNPLTKEGETASFNEEGRMHMTVSLLLECHGEIKNGEVGFQELAQHMKVLCQTQKLAGGFITDIRNVRICALTADDKNWRAIRYSLMPGFVLLDRSALLKDHFQQLHQQQPDAEMFDAWLDFAAFKMKANESGDWQYQQKPAPGYLVPLMTGWQRISPLYHAGVVANARDAQSPFCFTEAVYGVGEWRGIHRIEAPEEIFWHYRTTETGYYCCGQFAQEDEAQDKDDPINFDDN
ncbi:type I-F CRISPR-associated protein Csy2 [Stenoxybacter acetivorans]|uniref:type I-F CRISPR-associated protein Csy2 n=1 Tax=Stenoxybacter acetivorans TaxID=422441 RepID=UPI00055D7F68|nr:type I-F CRISPR-associated protein Csy2 [Stenoxybacter acetivorans]